MPIKKKRQEPNFEQRVNNLYGHEAMDLKAREELIRRGVSRKYKNLPKADYTDKPIKTVASRKKSGK